MVVVEVVLVLPPGAHQPLLGWDPIYTGPQLAGPADEVSLPETLNKVCKLE